MSIRAGTLTQARDAVLSGFLRSGCLAASGGDCGQHGLETAGGSTVMSHRSRGFTAVLDVRSGRVFTADDLTSLSDWLTANAKRQPLPVVSGLK